MVSVQRLLLTAQLFVSEPAVFSGVLINGELVHGTCVMQATCYANPGMMYG